MWQVQPYNGDCNELHRVGIQMEKEVNENKIFIN